MFYANPLALVLYLINGNIESFDGPLAMDRYLWKLTIILTFPFIACSSIGFFLYNKSGELKLTFKIIYILTLISSLFWMHILKIDYFFELLFFKAKLFG